MKKRKNLNIWLPMLMFLLAMMSTATAEIIFVDADASGANNGSSWTDAYRYLQDGLAVAWSGDEIRVAQGIYKPDEGIGITPGDREATFQLVNEITIKGGYAGFGEPDPDARDIEVYETVLSGDLLGNDGPDFANNGDNSFHVVTGSETNETAVLDGFTITGGNANGQWSTKADRGGGMFNDDGSPKVTNCTFRDNSAKYRGGGICNKGDNSNPMLTNCTFKGNWAYYGGAVCNSWKSKPTLTNCAFIVNTANHDGGGMYNEYSSPTITNCTFTANSANKGNGGGMLFHGTSSSRPILTNCLFSSNSASKGGAISCIGPGPAPFPGTPPAPWRGPIITNCTISGNSASAGAGIYNSYSVPILSNCTLSGNSAVEAGGGIHNTYHANIMVTNCTFSGNSAKYDGGGMANRSSNPTLTNCIFTGNSADSGGSMYNDWSSPTLANCTFAGNSAPNGNGLACDSYKHQWPSNLQLTNCILWDSGEEIWNNDESTIAITYSDVESGWPGEGNIDADPSFVQPGYWDINIPPSPPPPSPLLSASSMSDTLQYIWIEGDYHLLPDSPCIDAGDPNYIAEPNATDLDGKPRVVGGQIDMGAYEYSPAIPAEVRIVPRTINLTSKGKWISCYIWLPEDHDVADIDSNSILLNCKIQAESVQVNEQQQITIARFYRSEVHGILEVGQVELTISGELMDGTVFEGTDTIRVIDKGKKK